MGLFPARDTLIGSCFLGYKSLSRLYSGSMQVVLTSLPPARKAIESVLAKG